MKFNMMHNVYYLSVSVFGIKVDIIIDSKDYSDLTNSFKINKCKPSYSYLRVLAVKLLIQYIHLLIMISEEGNKIHWNKLSFNTK